MKEEFQLANKSILYHKDVFDDLSSALEIFKAERADMKKNIDLLTLQMSNKLDFHTWESYNDKFERDYCKSIEDIRSDGRERKRALDTKLQQITIVSESFLA